jgi:GNAT superfamily N-acetyltransferase
MDMEAYKAGQGAVADALMGTVLIAEAEAGAIAGWAAADAGCLHYVYVRQNLRRFGVARRLLEVIGPVSEYSHWTPMAQRLVAGARFNPYRAWRPR